MCYATTRVLLNCCGASGWRREDGLVTFAASTINRIALLRRRSGRVEIRVAVGRAARRRALSGFVAPRGTDALMPRHHRRQPPLSAPSRLSHASPTSGHSHSHAPNRVELVGSRQCHRTRFELVTRRVLLLRLPNLQSDESTLSSSVNQTIR